MTTVPLVLDVRYLNAYVANKSPELATDRMLRVRQGLSGFKGRPHFVGWCEANKVLPLLDLRPNYRMVRAQGRESQTRGISDCAISVRKDLELLGQGAVRISEEVPEDSRFAPDRWAVWVAAEIPELGPVAYVVVHPNAQVQGREVVKPRVAAYAESMVSLDHLLAYLTAEGLSVVLAGDLNYTQAGLDAFSPYKVLTKYGMKVVANRRIDTIAATSDLIHSTTAGVIATKDVVRVPKEETGSDHYGLEVRLTQRGQR